MLTAMIQNYDHCVVLHVTGPDRPGVTATLATIVSQEKGAYLSDIGQSVVHGYLSLCAVVQIDPGSDALRKILFAVSELGLRVEVSTFRTPQKILNSWQGGSSPRTSFCVTMLGDLTDGTSLSKVTQFLASQSLNIGEIKTLSQGFLRGLELIVEVPDSFAASSAKIAALKGDLLRLSTQLNIDLAVQKNDTFRRNKRLMCLDVDSTFVQMELVDELARLAGCQDKVSKITEQAMNGDLDFESALRQRVACLAGLEFSKAENLIKDIPLTPGCETMVKFLKSLGVKVGLVSGGFDFLVDRLKNQFELDFAFSNKLEIKDGRLTGHVVGTIVDAQRKAQVLLDMSQVFKCRPEQSVAVGDGANDLLMLESAGLGIAFRAKTKLREAADLSINYAGLDAVLYLMGYKSSDVQQLVPDTLAEAKR